MHTIIFGILLGGGAGRDAEMSIKFLSFFFGILGTVKGGAGRLEQESLLSKKGYGARNAIEQAPNLFSNLRHPPHS